METIGSHVPTAPSSLQTAMFKSQSHTNPLLATLEDTYSQPTVGLRSLALLTSFWSHGGMFTVCGSFHFNLHKSNVKVILLSKRKYNSEMFASFDHNCFEKALCLHCKFSKLGRSPLPLIKVVVSFEMIDVCFITAGNQQMFWHTGAVF